MLYNSEKQILNNIDSYVSQVDKVYAIDNSEVIDSNLISSITLKPGIEYHWMQGNKGIAAALNKAAQLALDMGYDYLLMMDDDSLAPPELVSSLHNIIDSDPTIGIVASQSDPSVQRNDVQQVLTAITSGSILSLSAYQNVGPFLDDLFIDWVDHEYCFRLSRHGYRVIMANRIVLSHRLGLFKTKRILGIVPIRFRSHNPTRLYYKFRNSIYVIHLYKKQLPIPFVLSVCYELAVDIAKVTFVEDKKRVYRQAIQKAIKDLLKKKFGKLESKFGI